MNTPFSAVLNCNGMNCRRRGKRALIIVSLLGVLLCNLILDSHNNEVVCCSPGELYNSCFGFGCISGGCGSIVEVTVSKNNKQVKLCEETPPTEHFERDTFDGVNYWCFCITIA